MKSIIEYINEVSRDEKGNRMITYKKSKGIISARDSVGLLAHITYDDDREEYYIHMVNGMGSDHYEKTLKDCKNYLSRI